MKSKVKVEYSSVRRPTSTLSKCSDKTSLKCKLSSKNDNLSEVLKPKSRTSQSSKLCHFEFCTILCLGPAVITKTFPPFETTLLNSASALLTPTMPCE